jgi:hypothetical protein
VLDRFFSSYPEMVMKTLDFIRLGMNRSAKATLMLIDDMKDRPLTFPTARGGNHPLWILGHLAYSEGYVIQEIMLGRPNPLAHWKDLFSNGTEPSAEASRYPDFESARKAFLDIRAETMSVLEGLNDADLERPSKNCPAEMQEFLGTYGQCFLLSILHPTTHRGQVADARRSLGLKPLRM